MDAPATRAGIVAAATALRDEMGNPIHALSMKTLTPEEAAAARD